MTTNKKSNKTSPQNQKKEFNNERVYKTHGLLNALDIGTEKITCSVAGLPLENGNADLLRAEEKTKQYGKNFEFPRISLLGFSQRASRGITERGISDFGALQDAILSALYEVEKKTQQNITEVYINIPATWIRTHIVTSKLILSTPVPIQSLHLRKLFRMIQHRVSTDEDYFLNLWPLHYQLDGIGPIQDPIGMIGKEFSATCFVETGARTAIQNLSHCIGQCSLNIAKMLADPNAASFACLDPDEAELGATLVDIGGSITQIACFLKGNPVAIASIPLGGGHITSDLARGLGTSSAQAERLKTLYGNLFDETSSSAELVPVALLGAHMGPDITYVPREKVSAIIKARVDEILECIEEKMKTLSVDPIVFQKIVLTGGTCQLSGLVEVAQKRWPQTNVRLGIQSHIDGSDPILHLPSFSTAAGLLCCASQDYLGKPPAAYDAKPLRFWQRLTLWLNEHMN